MATTGLETFDRAVHAANTWLHELSSRMGWEDRRKAWRVLSLSLRMIRDALPTEEAAKLSAQLPLLIRGTFWEGWRPAGAREAAESAEAFLAPLAEAFDADLGFEAEPAFREVLAVLAMHVSAGEVEDVRVRMPEAVRGLWEDEAG